MPSLAPVPPELTSAPFTGATAAAVGVSRHVLKGQRFLRLFRDVYCAAELSGQAHVRREAALLLAPHAALSHTSAAMHWGIPLPPAMLRDPVHLAVPLGSEQLRARGIVAHELRLQPSDVVVREGIRVTSPTRTLTDLAPWLSLADLVAALDSSLRAGTVTRDQLVTEVESARGRRGVQALRGAADLADPRSESPQESRLRVFLVCGGLPAFEANIDVCDHAGQWIARGDLVCEAYKLLVEYDGVGHLDDAQRKRDLIRRNALQSAGWQILTYSADSMRVPAAIVGEVWHALLTKGWPAPRSSPLPLESVVVRQPRRPR